ncbi:MAG: spore coat protein U domain-containing protein [Rudaea sp.]|uniref:Csu type fimbrial protein n=1 Tax=unclassified Rudaea TaxID=2627037 RepID=UPI0010F452BD|nr:MULTISPECIES: spore coat U domain-containing protein [unclassified Rudaea]MBN8887083.1 spore coat protein U domain-containing protein [Rudaea sp.]MBR0344746.1 spore coat protein U domain-containing protein [Rudaea sp.]
MRKLPFYAFALLGLLLFAAPAVRAQNITCTLSATDVLFSSVDPLSSQTDVNGSVSYSCRNTTGTQRSARICLSIGEAGGGPTNPRQMSGTGTLQFQLYEDVAHTQVWGSDVWGGNPAMGWSSNAFTLTIPANQTRTGAVTMYGRVIGGQTGVAPGSYVDAYGAGDTLMTINEQTGTTAPANCGGTTVNGPFTFRVTANVIKNCTVSANDLIFTSVPSGTVPPAGNTGISMTCSSGTKYYVGLASLNTASTTGVGQMKGSGTNTDTIAYQLYSNSALTTVWGNTATTTTVGNGMAGTGSGAAQSMTVYAKVTGSTDVTPDTYSDIVQVNVNY